MKVLITVPYLQDPGGVASYYNSVLPHLKQSCNTYVEVFEMGRASKKISAYPVLDQLRFRNKLKSDNFDVVHINPSLNFKSFIRDGLFALWSKRKKLPVIVFYHGWQGRFYDKIYDFLDFFFNQTYGRADLFIVLGSEFERKLRHKGIAKPIHIMTTAVDESLHKNFSFDAKISRIKKDGPIRLLFLSRIEEEKGVFETIKACQDLLGQGYEISLSIAGDGSAKARVDNYINNCQLQSNIHTAGYVQGERKTRVFEEHDIYCLPTYHGEGMPNSVLEAMSFGLPVVTRPVGGIKDFFVDGKMGYLSQSIRPEEIAGCLKKLISDKDHICDIANYNYEYAKNNFLASQVAEKLIALYRLINLNI